MAIITEYNRVQRANDFFPKNLYIGFGRTTAWADESSPPAPSVNATEIEELQFISKASINYVKPNGSQIIFKDTKWDLYDPPTTNDLYTNDIKYLYIRTTLLYDDFDFITFRQIGILENPVDSTGTICTNDKYTSSQLNSQGMLHYLDNRLKTVRQDGQQETVAIILEF